MKTDNLKAMLRLVLALLFLSCTISCAEDPYTESLRISISSGDPAPARASITYMNPFTYQDVEELRVRVVIRQISQFEYEKGLGLEIEGVLETVEVSEGPKIAVNVLGNSIARNFDMKYSLELSPDEIIEVRVAPRSSDAISKRLPRQDGLYWSEIQTTEEDGPGKEVVVIFKFNSSGIMRFAPTDGSAVDAAEWIASAPNANDGSYELVESTLHLKLGDSTFSPHHEAYVADDGASLKVLTGGFAGSYEFLKYNVDE